MIRRQYIEQDFFVCATEMRNELDVLLDSPYQDVVAWSYFSVPKLYTFLKAKSRDIFSRPLFQSFMERLRKWSLDELGLVPTADPTLNLMVNGCGLSLHSDFHNGALGYVYSLTRWDTRRFSGGETLLLRDGIPSYKKHQVQGDDLYELIPAFFNQLLVFDDRIVHGVPTIEGSMDPKEGRIALVGHLRATGIKAEGAIPASLARRTVLEWLPGLAKQIHPYSDVQGTFVCRILVTASGSVGTIHVLTDNLVTPSSGYGASSAVNAVRECLQANLMRLRFPPAARESRITIPVLVPVPDLRPIELRASHSLGTDVAAQRMRALMLDGLDNDASSGDTLVVSDPIDGVIRIGPDSVAAAFDPPMWVSSQRAQLELDLEKKLHATLVGLEKD